MSFPEASLAHAFFQTHAHPAFAFLSDAGRQVLTRYLETGNPRLRERKLLEFFRSLDWLPLTELRPFPFASLPQAAVVEGDILAYLEAKAAKRQKDSERRKNHRLNVYEYFRQTVSPSDKALLEGLRDYELDLTGRDVNWQHYFTLKSFRQIDAFVATSGAERQRRIEAFKADVETYRRNVEKLRHQAQCGDAHGFDFDDWCEYFGEEAPSGPRQRRDAPEQAPLGTADELGQAYQCLGLSSGVDFQAVKQRFRALTLRHHPDLPGGCAEMMKAIISAYETLKQAL